MRTIRLLLVAGLIAGLLPFSAVFAQDGDDPEITLTWWLNPWRIRPPGFPADESPTGEEFPAWISEEFMKLHPNVTVEFEVVPNSGYLRSEEHTSELQSRGQLVCRLLLETKIYILLAS